MCVSVCVRVCECMSVCMRVSVCETGGRETHQFHIKHVLLSSIVLLCVSISKTDRGGNSTYSKVTTLQYAHGERNFCTNFVIHKTN